MDYALACIKMISTGLNKFDLSPYDNKLVDQTSNKVYEDQNKQIDDDLSKCTKMVSQQSSHSPQFFILFFCCHFQVEFWMYMLL